MAVYSIGYSALPLPPTAAFPTGITVYRPVVITEVSCPTSGLLVKCFAILDSGADHCTFPLSFTKALGFDSATMNMEMTAGVGSAANPTFYETVDIRITLPGMPVLTFTTSAGFTPGMDAHGIGLLGQYGFFETYRVQFDHKAKVFRIEV